jgi:hypothetical protein
VPDRPRGAECGNALGRQAKVVSLTAAADRPWPRNHEDRGAMAPKPGNVPAFTHEPQGHITIPQVRSPAVSIQAAVRPADGCLGQLPASGFNHSRLPSCSTRPARVTKTQQHPANTRTRLQQRRINGQFRYICFNALA